jgi:hypothetical protein
MKTLAAVLLLASLASSQTTYEDVIRARVSLAQELGFSYGLAVEKQLIARAQKNLPDMLAACDYLDKSDAMVKSQLDHGLTGSFDSSLLLAELGDMRTVCKGAREPGAHFQ